MKLIKRSFWFFFWIMWKKTILEYNVCFVFIFIVIHSLNPSLVFSQIQLKILSLELNNEKTSIKIPASVKSICCYIKILRSFNNYKTQLANNWKKMTIKNKILHYKNQSFQKVLQAEQKC